jgi:hypothetical protein
VGAGVSVGFSGTEVGVATACVATGVDVPHATQATMKIMLKENNDLIIFPHILSSDIQL